MWISNIRKREMHLNKDNQTKKKDYIWTDIKFEMLPTTKKDEQPFSTRDSYITPAAC